MLFMNWQMNLREKIRSREENKCQKKISQLNYGLWPMNLEEIWMPQNIKTIF